MVFFVGKGCEVVWYEENIKILLGWIGDFNDNFVIFMYWIGVIIICGIELMEM